MLQSMEISLYRCFPDRPCKHDTSFQGAWNSKTSKKQTAVEDRTHHLSTKSIEKNPKQNRQKKEKSLHFLIDASVHACRCEMTEFLKTLDRHIKR